MQRTVALLGLLLIAGWTAPTHAGLIVNGSFEAPDIANASFLTIGPGTSGLPGWSIPALRNVDVVDLPLFENQFSAFDQQQILDLNGTQRGAIFQDLTASVGQTYSLTFAFADNVGVSGVQQGVVTIVDLVNGELLVNALLEHSTSTSTNANWTLFSQEFVATSLSLRLRFAAINEGNGGIFLDAVDINPVSAAVPEPASLAIWLSGVLGAFGLVRLRRKSMALASALLAMSFAASESSAAINARVASSGLDPNGHASGERTATFEGTYGYSEWFGTRDSYVYISAGTGSTDGVFRAAVRNSISGGYQGQPAESRVDAMGAYQDVAIVSGLNPLPRILIPFEVTASVHVATQNPVYYGLFHGNYGSASVGMNFTAGQAGIGDVAMSWYGDRFMGDAYASYAVVSVRDDNTQPGLQRMTTTNAHPSFWNSYEFWTDPVVPEIVHFRGVRIAEIEYDPTVGGYRFGARLRLQAVAAEAAVSGDATHSVSILDVTDLQGNSIRDRVTFQSGMTFASAEALPEPASLVIWGLIGTSLIVGGRLHRRKQSSGAATGP